MRPPSLNQIGRGLTESLDGSDGVARHAAGSSMPWEAPLQSILESIQGRFFSFSGGAVVA